MNEQSLWQRFIDLFSPGGAGSPDPWIPWAIFGVIVLLALVGVWFLARSAWRALFRRREPSQVDWDRELREDLATYGPAPALTGDRLLTVYHVPVRVRLVVVAPAGKEEEPQTADLGPLVDRVLPGLGAVVAQDQPHIRIWPPQLSHHGFAAAFFRRTLLPEAAGQPSHWVLVAGRAMVGRKPVLLALALWAEEANTLGRIELEPHQWLDVLRLKKREE